MIVLVTSKNEGDPSKTEDTRVLTRLYVDFSDTQWQLTPQPSTPAEIQTHPSFYGYLPYQQNEEGPIKNEGARVLTTFLPL